MQLGTTVLGTTGDPSTSPSAREPFDAGIIYASRSPAFPSGPNPLVIHDRNDVQVGEVDPSTFPVSPSTAILAQWNSSLAVTGGTTGQAIHRLDIGQDGSNPHWSELIPGSAVTIAPRSMRQDTTGRLIIASTSGALRFTASLVLEASVSFTGAPDLVTIAHDGDHVYGVRVSGGTLTVLQWSIDGGGGAPTTLATHTARAFGRTGIAVAPDGTVVVAAPTEDGNGSLGDPAVKKVLIYIVGGATYDISAAVPDVNGGNPNPPTDTTIYNNVGMGGSGRDQMTAETYEGERNAWFVLAHSRTGGTDGYLIGVSVDSGAVFHSSLHDAGGNTAIGNSDIFISTPVPVGCTAQSHNGDIYAYLPSPSTNGGIYRYDALAGALKEIIPVSPSELLPTAKTLRLQGGNLYAVGGTPGKLVKVAGVAPHTVTLLHDWTGNVDGDTGAESITFDSDGNIYVRLHGALGTGGGGAGTRAVVLYKLDPTGTILTRTVLPTDYDATAGFVWLANDDKTLLYDCYRDADGFEVVKRYDLDADAPLADWYRMTSTYDTTAPYFSSTKPGAVYLPTRKLVRAVGNQQTESSIVDSTVGYRGSDRFLYESQHLVLGSFADGGCDTDSDPDNVSLWIDSTTAEALYRFNITTGALTRTLSLADEGGTAYSGFPFAICGGAGGFGNPPPSVVVTRNRNQISWLFA